VWQCCGTWYDRSPWWYALHAEERHLAHEAIVWASYPAHGTLPPAGVAVLQSVQALRTTLAECEREERRRRQKK